MARLVGIGSRIPREIYELIEKEARVYGVTRSEVIRHWLKRYLELISENAQLKRELEDLKFNLDGEKKVREKLMKRIEELRKEADTWRELYEKLKKENEKLKTKVKTLERILELRKEAEKQKERERRNRLWRWLEEHLR